MKNKRVAVILLCVALVIVLLSLCKMAKEADPDFTGAIDPATLCVAKSYQPGSGALLASYTGYDQDTFEGVCRYYRRNGYTLYSSADVNENRFCTFTKGDALAHIYWIDSHQELNIVTDAHGAVGLPTNAWEGGSRPTGITQLQQPPHQQSGMAYVVTLSDGSKSDLHIRAWLITHSHNDHYFAFSEFAKTYRENGLDVQLDCVMFAPINDAEAIQIDPDESPYFSTTIYDDIGQFDGAKVCYLYTGMVFTLANVKMEILFTPDELFIDGNIAFSNEEFFNETSVVSRISAVNPEETGETLDMVFLGDAGNEVGKRLMLYYGTELRTHMVQISHHGVENFPLAAYQMICPAVLFYPCNMSLYNLPDRDADVRQAMRESPIQRKSFCGTTIVTQDTSTRN